MISSMKTTKVTCPLMTSGAAQSMLVIIGDGECETVTWIFFFTVSFTRW